MSAHGRFTACPEARVLCGLGTPDEALIVHPDMPHRAIFRRESLEKKGQYKNLPLALNFSYQKW